MHNDLENKNNKNSRLKGVFNKIQFDDMGVFIIIMVALFVVLAAYFL